MDDAAKREVWARYVGEITGGLGPQAIANKIKDDYGFGPSQPSVGRWLGAKHLPKPAEAAILARAFDANVLGAFVAADFLTVDEADMGLDAAALRLLDRIGVSGAYGAAH